MSGGTVILEGTTQEMLDALESAIADAGSAKAWAEANNCYATTVSSVRRRQIAMPPSIKRALGFEYHGAWVKKEAGE